MSEKQVLYSQNSAKKFILHIILTRQSDSLWSCMSGFCEKIMCFLITMIPPINKRKYFEYNLISSRFPWQQSENCQTILSGIFNSVFGLLTTPVWKLQSTFFKSTLDTTTKFVIMTIWMSQNLHSRGNS